MAAKGSRHALPSWEWPLAGFGHAAVFLVVTISQCGAQPAPLFRPEDAIMVQLAGPPAVQSRMPQKAERAPDVAKGAQAADVAPPPNPSELSLPTDKPVKGDQKADVQRDALMEELRRDQLLKDLSAEVGKVDRARTGENTDCEGSTSQAGVVDPQLAKWVREANAALDRNFHPLPAICAANPKLMALASAPSAPDGTITGEAALHQSSKNASFDATCLRAFSATGKLPPTPPNHPEGLEGVLTCQCPK